MEYYERMKKLRKKRQMTQEEIAKKLNITQQQYYLYESGKRQLPLEILIKLCKIYNISADRLLGIEKSELEDEIKNKKEA